MNKEKTNTIPEGFTVSMALVDCLPVLFFSLSIIVLAARFRSMLFLVGAVLVILAGSLKVCWKFLLALAKKDVRILNRQMRFLMPAGFLLIAAALAADRDKWSLSAVIAHMTGFPSVLFFLVGIAGMCAMTWFAGHLDGMKAKSNWIEQCVNALAQGCFFLGILF